MSERTSVLEFAVLGLLHESPMHGYELRKRLNRARIVPCLLLRLALPVPEGSARLGLDRRGRGACPAKPLRAGRSKIVYRLTADGKEHLQDLLADRACRLGGRELRRAVRLLRPDQGRSGCGSSRAAAAGSKSGWIGPRRARQDQGADRQIHPGTPAPWSGVGRTRGPLAQRAHRLRASSGRWVRRGRARTVPPRQRSDDRRPDERDGIVQPSLRQNNDEGGIPWVRFA